MRREGEGEGEGEGGGEGEGEGEGEREHQAFALERLHENVRLSCVVLAGVELMVASPQFSFSARRLSLSAFERRPQEKERLSEPSVPPPGVLGGSGSTAGVAAGALEAS